MKQSKLEDLRKSEAQGHIQTLPEEPEISAPPVEVANVIDHPEDFRMAVGNAQMEGIDHIEVSEKLFKYLVKNSKSRYITYGDPGIKVYLAGTREEIQKEENMSAEAYAEYIAKKRANERK